MSRRSRSPSASPPGDLGIPFHCPSSPSDDDGSSFPAHTPPLEDDNLLREILVRLPPLPSSLPRAALVCKRWRRLLKDPAFFRRFRAHHRKAPLLGFFAGLCRPIFFTPTLDRPDRIPAERLNRFRASGEGRGHFCCCRHGLALLLGPERPEALVWDPVTGHQRRVPFPPGFHIKRQETLVRHAAMLCTAGGDGDSPFKLVLLRYSHNGILACLYESESGVWGNAVNTATPHEIDPLSHSVLIGNALCWRIDHGAVLEFDTERQSLRVIERPADARRT
ncbi:uncharacterized protein [Aegilops tauschii subsp. strangulata]|nr:uncharacterized protein LOC109783369 [Aegilops tauschii subsp. strangulata]XP_044330478.1 uncharacterized protein LOC123051610 [Triticum aestivum]